MFHTDVDSILNWDEIDIQERVFSVSKNFLYKNRNFIIKGVYGTGKGNTTRTSDDDIFNQDHLISLGKGSVDIKTYEISIGMKSLWNLIGWDVTPYIGFKKKKQDFIMSDHVEPHPFALEARCPRSANWEGNANVCVEGISNHGVSLSQFYIGREDENGNIVKTGESVSSTNIPGYATLSTNESYVNLAYGDRIEDTDFCFHIDGQDPNTFVCMEKGEDGVNLLNVFGGLSQIHKREGITHMYFVDWTGPFIGLNLEKQFSNKEFFNAYIEYFKPRYKVWGNWPNRTDWMHDPSFIDSGGSGYGLLFNFNYQYEYKPNLIFILGAEYEYLQNRDADTILYLSDGTTSLLEKSIIFSQYYSYGANIGIKIKW